MKYGSFTMKQVAKVKRLKKLKKDKADVGGGKNKRKNFCCPSK